MAKLAVVQIAPVFLDREKTLQRAVSQLEQAVGAGAELVVFPEAFVPGYPAWGWRLRPGGDWGDCEALHQRLWAQAVDLQQGDLEPLVEAARRHQVTVLCGLNERDSGASGTTLFNTYVAIGPDGKLLNRHRKLMPTNPERMVWGFGDGSGLQLVASPCGRLGSLICWENYMPLARYSLYAQGMDLLISPTYDSGDDWIASLRHIAREGGCWVVGSGNLLRGADLRLGLGGLDRIYPDPEEWVNPGDSVVIAPGGELVAGPLRQEAGILYAEIDPARVAGARRTFDAAGHYARPDLFQLQVNRKPQNPVEFS